MAIKRLHIPEGAPLWGPTKPHTLAVRLWEERFDDIETLRSGDYDVTPEAHKEKMPNSQHLTVMEDGTALFRTFAVGRTALTKLNAISPGSVEQLPAGKGDLLHIPQDAPGRLVFGDKPGRTNRGRLFLFNVIIWSPDLDDTANDLVTTASLDLTPELVSSDR